jgi:hypothetical protein
VATSNLEIVISAKDHASGILGGIGGAIGKIGKVVAGMAIGAAVAGITAMGAALALSVKEAMEAQYNSIYGAVYDILSKRFKP